jgi:hypothetical protein
MESLKINILCRNLSLNTIKAYYDISKYHFDGIQLFSELEGEYDACVVIDDVPHDVSQIMAKKFYYFGSETIYPIDYFFGPSTTPFLDQFDVLYGPYPYNPKFKPAIPALPFMFDDNHGSSTNPNSEVALTDLEGHRELGVYCVISSKEITETQFMRLRLLEYVSKKIGSNFHLFGNGFKPISTKSEVGYRFTHSIAIENRINPFLLSEKFFDPIILKNELFYLGGNFEPKKYSKFVTSLNLSSFDQIYRTISESLENYQTDKQKENLLTECAALALRDNFVTRIISKVTNDTLPESRRIKKLRPHVEFKKSALIKSPMTSLRWKFRKRFL